MKRKYVSFDVFDTCLIRRCGMPYKIWDLMADRLFDKDDSRGRLSFTGNRILAEERASRGIPDPTLNDIYEKFDVSQWGFEKTSIMNLEMAVEECELFPNPEILSVIGEYREEGFTIAFVSDMYLPTTFVKKILEKHGFCKDDDLFFVSADCKAGKYNGKLFDYVLKKTETKAKQWIHYGDNERSDYRIPKSKGIQSVLVKNTDFTKEEKKWLDDARFYKHKHEIELWAGLCRLVRLQNEQSFAATMAVDFISSIYVPYVHYVLNTAKQKNIRTLYFLARDGHIFWEIAKSLNAEKEGLECRYLKSSRRALHKCTFYNVDDFELKLTIGNALNQTIENALKFIGVEYNELSECTKNLFRKDFVLRTEERMLDFSKSLKENDSELIKTASKKNRVFFLNYLRQEGFFEKKSAFVDLGWVGSCRCIIGYILKKEGYEPAPTFYWGYNNALIYGMDCGDLFVFNKQYDLVSNYSCCNLFLEQYASMNDAGSTIAYCEKNGTVEAVEGEKNIGNDFIVKTNEFYVKKIAEQLSANILDTDSFNDIFLCCGLRQLENIQKNPSRKLLKFFSYVRVENYGVANFLIRKLPLKDFVALLVWGIPASIIWSEAAVKKTFGPFAPLYMKVSRYTSKTFLARKLRTWWETRK
jgi:predicted HAD superfamily hydrolase